MSAYLEIKTPCQVFIGSLHSMLEIPLKRCRLRASDDASIRQERRATEMNRF
jgi:hypothetical protein